MKLEVGMYVRTEEGEISKIEWITFQSWEGLDNTVEASFWLENKERLEYPRDKFKASHNIKELIEDDDLIKFKIYGELFICKVYNKSLINYDGEVFDLEELDIVSILTKEQYESMSYKVGE